MTLARAEVAKNTKIVAENSITNKKPQFCGFFIKRLTFYCICVKKYIYQKELIMNLKNSEEKISFYKGFVKLTESLPSTDAAYKGFNNIYHMVEDVDFATFIEFLQASVMSTTMEKPLLNLAQKGENFVVKIRGSVGNGLPYIEFSLPSDKALSPQKMPIHAFMDEITFNVATCKDFETVTSAAEKWAEYFLDDIDKACADRFFDKCLHSENIKDWKEYFPKTDVESE